MSAKTAIVTGASKGIGRAIARALAADGFDLALCARNANGLANTANEIRAAFPNCQILTFSADLSQRAETLNFAKMIQENWTRCDVLVNNAGIFLAGSIADEPEDQLEQLISTNLYSAYHLTRGVLPLVKLPKDTFLICVRSQVSKPIRTAVRTAFLNLRCWVFQNVCAKNCATSA